MKSDYCRSLANFKDEFVFLFSNVGSYRYSLAEDKWEEVPMMPCVQYPSACSLGDKVYVLCPKSGSIKVLHNTNAPVSSEEMHWREMYVPITRGVPAFAPLNLTEIFITGCAGKEVENIVTFDTTTCEFKKEVVNRYFFECYNN